MKSGSYIPDRGDIVWLNFTPQTGHEQRGKRPAFVAREIAYIGEIPHEVLVQVQKNVLALVG